MIKYIALYLLIFYFLHKFKNNYTQGPKLDGPLMTKVFVNQI